MTTLECKRAAPSGGLSLISEPGRQRSRQGKWLNETAGCRVAHRGFVNKKPDSALEILRDRNIIAQRGPLELKTLRLCPSQVTRGASQARFDRFAYSFRTPGQWPHHQCRIVATREDHRPA